MTTSIKTIIAGLNPDIREYLRAYADAAPKATTVENRRGVDGNMKGYLRGSRDAGALLNEHCNRLLELICDPDGYRIIAACFPNPKPIVTDGERSLWRLQYNLCGGFERSLWDAILAADSTSLGAIEKGFPEHVEAYRRYGNEAGYWDNLCERINA